MHINSVVTNQQPERIPLLPEQNQNHPTCIVVSDVGGDSDDTSIANEEQNIGDMSKQTELGLLHVEIAAAIAAVKEADDTDEDETATYFDFDNMVWGL